MSQRKTKEKFKKKIMNQMKMETDHQKTDGIRKANVKGKFIAINANNKKLEKSQINNLTYIEAVEKMNR